jgi:hypothetical protein
VVVAVGDTDWLPDVPVWDVHGAEHEVALAALHDKVEL